MQRPKGGMPGMPPGHPPFGGEGAHGGGEHGGHGGEHECPGHGPMDSPPQINWYQGLLGVNNEKADSPSGLDKLLWRYKNEQDECDPKNQEPPVLANLINFGIVVLLLFRFGGTPLREGLIKRKKTIMADIEAAEQLRGDAEERLKKYQKQLANIEHRRKELEEEYRAQFEAEKKRILSEAEEKRVRMRKDAEFRVAQELRQAQAELLVEAVDGAIKAAEDLIKKKVQPSDLDRIADEYLVGLGPALKASSKSLSGGQS
jgi:F-type H+-transporting ATPase subunit b